MLVYNYQEGIIPVIYKVVLLSVRNRR